MGRRRGEGRRIASPQVHQEGDEKMDRSQLGEGRDAPLQGNAALERMVSPFRPLSSKPARLACKPWSWDVKNDTLPDITLENLDKTIWQQRLVQCLVGKTCR